MFYGSFRDMSVMGYWTILTGSNSMVFNHLQMIMEAISITNNYDLMGLQKYLHITKKALEIGLLAW